MYVHALHSISRKISPRPRSSVCMRACVRAIRSGIVSCCADGSRPEPGLPLSAMKILLPARPVSAPLYHVSTGRGTRWRRTAALLLFLPREAAPPWNVTPFLRLRVRGGRTFRAVVLTSLGRKLSSCIFRSRIHVLLVEGNCRSTLKFRRLKTLFKV